MTLLHDPITPAAFMAVAAAAAQALNQPITNAAEAHHLAVAEALVLDQFDSPTFDLAEALALKEELERVLGERTLVHTLYDVRLDFDALAELVGCEATARQAALRAGFWLHRCAGKIIWANYAPSSPEPRCQSLWLDFRSLTWTGRAFIKV